MKKTVLAIVLILSLLASFMNVLPFIKMARAKFVPSASISITFPVNKTYASNSLGLNCTADYAVTGNKLIVCSIDGGANFTIYSQYTYVPALSEVINAKAVLPELSDGSHHLEVYAEGEGPSGYDQVYFSIDTIPPAISNLSIENKTYNSTEIPIAFNINETTSQISYSLDNNANVTINGNTTLTGLTEGSHNLTVYASDTVGNMGATEIIHFKIKEPEPFPTALVIASLSAVAIVGIGLLVYFKKLRGEAKPS